ncbi:MAG: histidinol-phosphatase [Candidatus Zixiibacteriota bacterium]
MGKKIGDWYYYSGVIHIHTTVSDGTRDIAEIIEIGREVELDFMMFADHMTLEHRDRGYAGRYGNTLVIIGYEHNDADDKNHYLLFGTPGVYPEEMTALEYVAAGNRDGALGIIAHPDEIRHRMADYPPYPWLDWSVNGYQGMELWNHMSEWMERLTPQNRIMMALSPRKSMIGPTDRALKKWDELNQKQKCVGVASVDAHQFPYKIGPFTVQIFPYKVHFKALRTHLLMSEPLADKFEPAQQQVFEALRDCRVFFSNMRWGTADDFEFYAENDNEQVVSGGALKSRHNARLRIRLPERAKIRIVVDGQYVFEKVTDRLEYKVNDRGLYRVEVWKSKRGWIFSNHIRIGLEK